MNGISNRLVETCLVALLFAGMSPAIAQVIEDQKLTASDGFSGDAFGSWVNIDGDTIAIGARLDDDKGAASGSAYVFHRIGGTWVEQPKLLASDGAAGDRFGGFVAVEGDTALIGATGFFLETNVAGAAYVFHRVAGAWIQQPKLVASDGEPDDEFGRVAIDGNTAVISAVYDGDNGVEAGAVYIFTRFNGIWTEQAKLLASDGAPGHVFGRGVAIDGDTLVVGANRGDGNVDDAGAAYIFTRTNGVWTEQAKLVASDGMAGDRFGGSNALDGDTAVIGSIFNDEIGNRAGAAYIFTRSNGNWTEQVKLLASDGTTEDQFGRPAISGNTVVIGAPRNDSRMGAAYIFTAPNGTWTEQAKVLASDGAPNHHFGRSSIDGTTLLVGGGNAAYVFSLPDVDFDGSPNESDNCPTEFNPGQADLNVDGFGDACVDPSVTIPPNADVDPTTTVGAGTDIDKDVTVGANSSVGGDVDLKQNVSVGDEVEIGDGATLNKNVEIENEATIGPGVIIGKNVFVGTGAVVGANSIVGKNTVICPYAEVGADSNIGKNNLVQALPVLAPGTVLGGLNGQAPNPTDCL